MNIDIRYTVPRVDPPAVRRSRARWIIGGLSVGLLGLSAVASLVLAQAVDPPKLPAAGSVDARPAGRHPAIEVGEVLTFDIKWGVVKAGQATMSVTELRETSQGHASYRAVSTATSNSVFDKIYPVRDRFISYMDAETLQSWFFEKHLREGKFRSDQVVQMDHQSGVALYHDGKEVEFTPGAFDVISAFYFVRTMPLEVGKEYFLDAHSDKKNYPIRVKVIERERVEVDAGTFDCLVVEPTLKSGAFFKNDGNLRIWLTDDERRVPVLMKSKIPVGSIAAELVSIERGVVGQSRLADSNGSE